MSACSPLMMLCACVVLPPNDVRNCTSWPSCASFHSDCHVEISLPYARYGLLYAASVTTGEAAGEEELHPAAPDALELEHAASPMSERTSGAARMRRLNHRGMERSFRLGRHRDAYSVLGLGLRWSGQPNEDVDGVLRLLSRDPLTRGAPDVRSHIDVRVRM